MADEPTEIELPPHVYVPGRSPRHPDRWFDDLKASVTPDIAPDQLHTTRAFKAGKAFFDAGYYWECHEILEVIWHQTKDPSPERDMVLAFIQLANARLKLLMAHPREAWRLCDMVETHLARCPIDRRVLGLDTAQMLAEAKATRKVARETI